MKKYALILLCLLFPYLGSCSNPLKDNEPSPSVSLPPVLVVQPSPYPSPAPSPAPSPIPSPVPTPQREEGKYYFRDSAWGMTREHIIELEGSPDSEAQEENYLRLTYEDITLAGYKAEMDYYLSNDDLLFECCYSFGIDNADFDIISNMLIEKYREPSEEDYWESPYGVFYDSFWTTWASSQTEVVLSLSHHGQTLGSSITIWYRDLMLYESVYPEPTPTVAPSPNAFGL